MYDTSPICSLRYIGSFNQPLQIGMDKDAECATYILIMAVAVDANVAPWTDIYISWSNEYWVEGS
jgi:hypothetical protein